MVVYSYNICLASSLYHGALVASSLVCLALAAAPTNHDRSIPAPHVNDLSVAAHINRMCTGSSSSGETIAVFVNFDAEQVCLLWPARLHTIFASVVILCTHLSSERRSGAVASPLARWMPRPKPSYYFRNNIRSYSRWLYYVLQREEHTASR